MTKANPDRWVSGLLAPVERERTATDLVVQGSLPPELDGRYVRNGPNPIGPMPEGGQEWFASTGMVHGVQLRDGQAEWYRNRYVRTREVTNALGEPERRGPSHDDDGDFVNTHVLEIGGRIFATREAGAFPVELTEDFDTIASSDFEGTLTTSFAAHTKRDPDTGYHHAITYWWPEESVHYLVVGLDARVIHDVEIPVGDRPLAHDTAITGTRVLVLDMPCTFSMEAATAGAAFPYRWNPERAARIGVLPLNGHTNEVQWCALNQCFVFHFLNAHDLPDGRIEAVVVRYAKVYAADPLGPNEGSPTLERWTIDPRAGTVREERLDDRGQEFPRIREDLVGRRARFGYAVGFDSFFASHVPLYKHDLVTGRSEMHDFGPTTVASEAVFVPRDGTTAEDDGWLLSYVTDASDGRSSLTVLHAQALGGDPVAVVELPQRVPNGFHGNWIPTSKTR